MKSYAEDIIKVINQEKKREELQKNDINRGYAEIFYNTVQFERKKLCRGEFSAVVPTFFNSMKEENIALKYGIEDRPEFVYTNEQEDIDMTFTFLYSEKIGKDILQVQHEMEQDIKEMYPDVLIEKNILNTKQELNIIQFLFPLQIGNETLLEVLFLFLVKNTWVIGTFCCPYTQKRDWTVVIKQILLSIQLEE